MTIALNLIPLDSVISFATPLLLMAAHLMIEYQSKVIDA